MVSRIVPEHDTIQTTPDPEFLALGVIEWDHFNVDQTPEPILCKMGMWRLQEIMLAFTDGDITSGQAQAQHC